MLNHWDASTRSRVLLVLCVFSVVLASSCFWVFFQFFREEKLRSIRESEEVRVNALAEDAQAVLNRLSERVRTWTAIGEKDSSWAQRVLESDSNIVRVALYRPTENVSHWEKVQAAGPQAEIKLPFGKALAQGSLAQIISIDEKPAIRFAIAVREHADAEANRVRDVVVVVDTRVNRWLASFAREQASDDSTYAFLADSDGRGLVTPGFASVDSLPILRNALASPSRLAVLPFSWQGKQWLGVSSTVGPLTAIAMTDLNAAMKPTRKFVEKAALFGLFGIFAAILLSTWFASLGSTGRKVELQPELGEEFAHLLESIKLRIDQISGEIAPYQTSGNAEEGIHECQKKLAGLSHQAEWAAEIFDRMRNIPGGANTK